MSLFKQRKNRSSVYRKAEPAFSSQLIENFAEITLKMAETT